MGLLSEGSPLTWEETKKQAEHVRKHGILQFINLYHRLKDRSNDCLLWGDEVCAFSITACCRVLTVIFNFKMWYNVFTNRFYMFYRHVKQNTKISTTCVTGIIGFCEIVLFPRLIIITGPCQCNFSTLRSGLYLEVITKWSYVPWWSMHLRICIDRCISQLYYMYDHEDTGLGWVLKSCISFFIIRTCTHISEKKT